LIEIDIPGRGIYRFEHLALDLNGTIALDGTIIDGVQERVQNLSRLIDISIITADTAGNAQQLAEALGVKLHKIATGNESAQKLEFIQRLGSKNTVAIGAGSNDVPMLKEAGLGICVLGPEGTAAEAMNNCDVVASDINVALDLLLEPKRLLATLRR
jgi:P-type E1-E2 ATPase